MPLQQWIDGAVIEAGGAPHATCSPLRAHGTEHLEDGPVLGPYFDAVEVIFSKAEPCQLLLAGGWFVQRTGGLGQFPRRPLMMAD